MNRIVVTNDAASDLDDIWSYIYDESKNAADRLIDNIIERFSTLAQFPEMGRERSDILTGMRSFRVGRYFIFYRQIEDGIEILRVLHSARDIDALFQ